MSRPFHASFYATVHFGHFGHFGHLGHSGLYLATKVKLPYRLSKMIVSTVIVILHPEGQTIDRSNTRKLVSSLGGPLRSLGLCPFGIDFFHTGCQVKSLFEFRGFFDCLDATSRSKMAHKERARMGFEGCTWGDCKQRYSKKSRDYLVLNDLVQLPLSICKSTLWAVFTQITFNPLSATNA